jgi:tRNA-2-methylthio-N6-dimethylallyladenosine synthase
MNERDAETIAGLLGTIDYTNTEKIDEADVIIVHTCCVRASAENKIFGKIGELKHLKKAKPNLIIGICGCMVQQKEAAEKLLQKAPHVDLIFGTHNLHQLPELIRQNLLTGTRIFEVWDEEGQIVENLPAQREGSLKAYVTITYGCNNYCTYCIVPYVRGRERSRLPEEIIKEITQLGAEGFREITLLGQNVNSYGKDFIDEQLDFSDLLAKVDQIPEIWRIRYMTSHPRDFNAKVVQTVKNSQHLCPHFHLPIQAGCNRVLAAMNRGYTKEQYLDLIAIIKEEIPAASITTDIIVGFPGETEEDFEHTLDVMKKVKFDAAYTFLYSQRLGTPAATMEAQISEEVKKQRLQKLMSVQNEISLEINQKLTGQEVMVLVEGLSKTKPELLTGRTDTNKIVIFPGDESLIGQLVPATVVDAKTWSLVGKVKGF